MKKFLWMALGSLLTILIILSVTFFSGYENNIDKMLRISVSYKGESLYTGLSSDICDCLTTAEKTKIYFGKMPNQENAIKINAPDRCIIYLYPVDEDSIIIRYEPKNGLKRTYQKTGYADFNDILKAFYELTDNKIFDETINYENVS